MKRIYFILVLVVFSFSCQEEETPLEKTFWVFPSKISSEFDPSKKDYFYVLFQDDLDYVFNKITATGRIEKNWIQMNEEFQIQGFDFEPGYFYKVSVIQKDLAKPSYSLIKIEEKLKDYSYLLEGDWKIKSINGTTNEIDGWVTFRSMDRSFKISSKCTGIRIRIGAMDKSNFTQVDEYLDFDNGSKICFNDNMGSITSAFRLSKKYLLSEGQTLIFTDSIGNEVLALIK